MALRDAGANLLLAPASHSFPRRRWLVAASDSRRARVLRTAEILAWTVGILLLVIWGGSRIRQTISARREVREFERARTSRPVATAGPAAKSEPAETGASARQLAWNDSPDQSLWAPERIRAWRGTTSAGTAIAVLRIPRIGLEVPVFEGTSDASLDRGVGHIEGTPAPGLAGNVGIAGHRDGFFRGLKDVVVGDAIEMETPTATVRYAVEALTLVEPDDVWVLDDTPSAYLSLVTCYPFYYTGSAPHRYIVRAAQAATAP